MDGKFFGCVYKEFDRFDEWTRVLTAVEREMLATNNAAVEAGIADLAVEDNPPDLRRIAYRRMWEAARLAREEAAPVAQALFGKGLDRLNVEEIYAVAAALGGWATRRVQADYKSRGLLGGR